VPQTNKKKRQPFSCAVGRYSQTCIMSVFDHFPKSPFESGIPVSITVTNYSDPSGSTFQTPILSDTSSLISSFLLSNNKPFNVSALQQFLYHAVTSTREEIFDGSHVSPLSWAFFGANTLWFIALTALVWWRRNYQPVKAREVFLMYVSLAATYFISFMVTWRFAFGRYDFPCFFFSFLLLMAYPGVFLPSILR